jgi:hypothetical protein
MSTAHQAKKPTRKALAARHRISSRRRVSQKRRRGHAEAGEIVEGIGRETEHAPADLRQRQDGDEDQKDSGEYAGAGVQPIEQFSHAAAPFFPVVLRSVRRSSRS